MFNHVNFLGLLTDQLTSLIEKIVTFILDYSVKTNH